VERMIRIALTAGLLCAMTAAAAPVGYDGPVGTVGDATPTGERFLLTEAYGGAIADAEKDPYDGDDDLMCWAATAANVLHWTGWGRVDDGSGGSLGDADAIFDYYVDHWTNAGGMMDAAWDWWFDGTNPNQGRAGWSQVDVPGGGFHPAAEFHQQHLRFLEDANLLWAIDLLLRQGCGVGAAIYRPKTGGGLYGHALTVWGVNTLDDDYVGLWVTDSDDAKSLPDPPDQLRYYAVSRENGRWYLQDYAATDTWYLGLVDGLAVVPEPSTATLLAGSLVVAAARRRRESRA